MREKVTTILKFFKSCSLTKANTDDRKPVPKLVETLNGWLFGSRIFRKAKRAVYRDIYQGKKEYEEKDNGCISKILS